MNLLYNSSSLLDSVHLSSSVSGSPPHWLGIRRSLTFHEGLEYTYTATIMCNKPANKTARMAVYVMGSTGSISDWPISTSDPLGYKVTEYIIDSSGSFNLYKKNDQVNFIASRDGLGKLRFVVSAGDWYLSNVSLTSAVELGFNPDETSIYMPIVNKRNEHLKFKIELYDINNNSVPVNLESDEIYFEGGNFVTEGANNILAGTSTVQGIL